MKRAPSRVGDLAYLGAALREDLDFGVVGKYFLRSLTGFLPGGPELAKFPKFFKSTFGLTVGSKRFLLSPGPFLAVAGG